MEQNIPIRNAGKSRIPSEKYGELKARCEDFRNQLLKERLSRIQAEGQLAKIQQEHSVEKKELEEEVEAFRAESAFTEDLRRRHKELEEKHAKLRTRLQEYESQQELQIKIKKLEHDLEAKEALCQVGLNIRLRYLEQARESVQYVDRQQLNHSNLEKGNKAAHGGNGDADALLVTSSFLTSRQKNKFTKVFRDVYKHLPAQRASMPRLLLEARDCQATISTMNILNSGLDRPLIERQRALDHIEIMESKSKKLKKDEFDSDPDMIRRLGLIKEFTGEIIKYDRKSGGVKKPDTSYRKSGSKEYFDKAEDIGGSPSPGGGGGRKREKGNGAQSGNAWEDPWQEARGEREYVFG